MFSSYGQLTDKNISLDPCQKPFKHTNPQTSKSRPNFSLEKPIRLTITKRRPVVARGIGECHVNMPPVGNDRETLSSYLSLGRRERLSMFFI